MTIQTLRELMGRQIGLPASFDGSITAYGNLSQNQQIELTAAVMRYIRQNPGQFTQAQVAVTTAEGSRAELTIPAGYADVGFWDEFENNAYEIVGKPFVAIGQGVSTSVNLIGTLLPVFALIAVAIFALPYIRKANTQ